MVMSFCAVLFPTMCFGWILNLIEPVSEGFPSYYCSRDFVLLKVSVSECLNGNYGQNCSSKCGHCRNNYPCDKLTGACTTCAPGYEGLYCFEGASCGSCIICRHSVKQHDKTRPITF